MLKKFIGNLISSCRPTSMHLLHQDACLLVLALVTMPNENYNDACLHQFLSIFAPIFT